MRFLIDENLSPRICTLLIADGHHATHIRDHGMASASDPMVLAKTAAEGLTLITAARGDFGRELARTRAVEPSVVLLRQLPDVVRAADVAALLLANLTPAVVSALDAGAFGTSRCGEPRAPASARRRPPRRCATRRRAHSRPHKSLWVYSISKFRCARYLRRSPPRRAAGGRACAVHNALSGVLPNSRRTVDHLLSGVAAVRAPSR